MKGKMFFLSLLALVGFVKAPAIGQAIDLVPGGETIGIEIRPDGLLISGTYDIKNGNSYYNPARDSDIKRGDLLFALENNHISSLEDFADLFNDLALKKDEVRISLKRNNNIIQRKLRIIKDGNRYRTGLYIKERLIGIGTVSFYDPTNQVFGALGHAIVDSESGALLEVKSGTIYESKVTGINKSSNGDPGAKVATFEENHPLGTILENTTIGIYGQYESLPSGAKAIPMALHDEVNLGKAEMYTVIKGSQVMKYDIEITNLVRQTYTEPKGITFKITDSDLIKATGGVVAGMSGSPIIQDGKLIGAVTHVLIDKVQYGYGIYMEWMWQEAQKIAQ